MVRNDFSYFEKDCMIILVITWKNNFNMLILKIIFKKYYFPNTFSYPLWKLSP
jgi:hypothetical protein